MGSEMCIRDSFKGLTVRDLLELAAGGKLGHNELCALLGKVGLCADEYIDREMSGALSGGEAKRIEIATVLARNAKLSVFDEPEAGIDLWSFARLVETCGLKFIGPKGDVIDALGNKSKAREMMIEAGVPVVPGSNGSVNTYEELKEVVKAEVMEEVKSIVINQVIKKVKKSKTLETIASELEEEVADIKPIYDVVIAAAPDYNIDIIKNKLAIN